MCVTRLVNVGEVKLLSQFCIRGISYYVIPRNEKLNEKQKQHYKTVFLKPQKHHHGYYNINTYIRSIWFIHGYGIR